MKYIVWIISGLIALLTSFIFSILNILIFGTFDYSQGEFSIMGLLLWVLLNQLIKENPNEE